MSALGGAIGVSLALIAEEVILASKGGPTAVSGIFGTAANAVSRLASANVPAIPDLKAKKTVAAKTKVKG